MVRPNTLFVHLRMACRHCWLTPAFHLRSEGGLSLLLSISAIASPLLFFPQVPHHSNVITRRNLISLTYVYGAASALHSSLLSSGLRVARVALRPFLLAMMKIVLAGIFVILRVLPIFLVMLSLMSPQLDVCHLVLQLLFLLLLLHFYLLLLLLPLILFALVFVLRLVRLLLMPLRHAT